jgi:hypothetical protein
MEDSEGYHIRSIETAKKSMCFMRIIIIRTSPRKAKGKEMSYFCRLVMKLIGYNERKICL